MSYANAIRDIPPRSTWIAQDGERVVVTSAAARHVVYRRVFVEVTIRPLCEPRGGVMHERDFRARFSPVYDRAAIRSQFSMSVANLGEFRVFWLPEHRRIMARSVACTRHFRVPDGAHLVGVYSAPCSPDSFFDDLDDLIRRLATEPTARDDRKSA